MRHPLSLSTPRSKQNRFILMSDYFYQLQIVTIPLLQVEEPSATMDRSRYVDPDKLKKTIKTLLNMPDLKVPQAMLLARFSNEEVANLSLRWFIQRSLPGKPLKSLKTHVSGPLLPPLPQPDHGERLCNRAINDKAVRIKEGSHAAGIGACEQAILATPSTLLPLPLALARPQGQPPSLVSTSTAAVKKQKSWNRVYYPKKKLHGLEIELAAAAVISPASIAVAAPAAIAAKAADPAAATASSAAAATASAGAAAADSWSFNTDGNVCTPAAQKMMKHRQVKPVVDNILRAGSMQARQLFSVVSWIILPWLLRASLQVSNCQKCRQPTNLFASNPLA
jgi:hypothetical protein